MNDYDQSDEEEYEYTYDDDSASDEETSEAMESASLEMDYDSPARDSSNRASLSNGLNSNGKQISSTNHSNPGSNKKKARSESLCGQIDVHMRDSDEGIHMMDAKELTPMMMERISEIAEVLGIPIAAAGPLLRNHKWSKERLIEEFCANATRTKENAGVLARCTSCDGSVQTTTTNTTKSTNNYEYHTCGICFDDELTQDEMLAMPCGHEFCLDCWKGYISSKVSDGPSCILAVCPEEKCNEVMTEEEVSKAIVDPLDETRKRYENYQLRNFVDVNGTSRWCPGPGCERVAVLSSSSGLFADSLSGMYSTSREWHTIECIYV
jgi:ariadne-1